MKGQAGFTVVECLVALIILGLGAALAMQDSWSGAWAAKQGWREVQALRLAQSVAAEAGIVFPATAEGMDTSEPGLPFRIRVRLEPQESGEALYRVEIFDETDGRLLASLARRAVDGAR